MGLPVMKTYIRLIPEISSDKKLLSRDRHSKDRGGSCVQIRTEVDMSICVLSPWLRRLLRLQKVAGCLQCRTLLLWGLWRRRNFWTTSFRGGGGFRRGVVHV